TEDATGKKHSWGNDLSYAKVAFGDPNYTMSLPMNFTVSTALDAVSHSLESYFSKAADDISDMYALSALHILLPTLKDIWAQGGMPTLEQREALYNASIYAGFAINSSGTLFCHTMGYYLSEEVGIPHGYACAAFLPEFISYSVPLAPQKAQRLFKMLGIYAEELRDTIKMLTEVDFEPISDEKLEEMLVSWKGVKNMEKTLGSFDTNAQREIAQRVLQKKLEEK
ncbi:MAG: iron-containing alcohol dehydrogenase, partial [Angelakisella sp.]